MNGAVDRIARGRSNDDGATRLHAKGQLQSLSFPTVAGFGRAADVPRLLSERVTVE